MKLAMAVGLVAVMFGPMVHADDRGSHSEKVYEYEMVVSATQNIFNMWVPMGETYMQVHESRQINTDGTCDYCIKTSALADGISWRMQAFDAEKEGAGRAQFSIHIALQGGGRVPHMEECQEVMVTNDVILTVGKTMTVAQACGQNVTLKLVAIH